MGTINFPNIAEQAGEVAQTPINALQEYQRVAALKQQVAQSQATTQGQQINNQQQQIDLQDQQTAHTLGPQFLQKDENGKITGFDNEGYYNALIGSGTNPAKIQALRQAQLTYQQGLTNLGKSQLDLQNEKNDKAFELTEPVRQLTQDQNADINRINAVHQANIPKLVALGIDPKTIPPSFASPQEAAAKLQDFETELGQHKQLLADSKTQSEAAQAAAKARSENATAAHQEFINNLTTKSKPGDFDNQIDGMFSPRGNATDQGQNLFVKAQTNAALARGDYEGAKKFIDQAYENKLALNKDISVATNPQIQQGKINVAYAEGQGRASIEAAAARGGDPAVATVPAKQVLPAKADYQKANADFAQNQAVTQRLNAMMQAAKSGNVIAYQIIPEEGTLQITTSQGVHRINMAEIQQYAGGGSLWQRMEGHFGKALTGASIPNSVLDDMAKIQQIQQQGSQSKYQNTIKGINQTYGSKFEPIAMNPANAAPQGSGEGQTATGPNGHKIVVRGGQWVDAQTGAPLR